MRPIATAKHVIGHRLKSVKKKDGIVVIAAKRRCCLLSVAFRGNDGWLVVFVSGKLLFRTA
jgi:hypothetical protein